LWRDFITKDRREEEKKKLHNYKIDGRKENEKRGRRWRLRIIVHSSYSLSARVDGVGGFWMEERVGRLFFFFNGSGPILTPNFSFARKTGIGATRGNCG